MATSTTNMRLVFESGSGNKISITYPYVDPDVDPDDVVALMEAIIENNDIYVEPPVKGVGAELIAKNTTEIDVSALDGE
jgi:hypothetical protein